MFHAGVFRAQKNETGDCTKSCIVDWPLLHLWQYIYKGKVKSSSLAYNRRETLGNRSLSRDPDRSWCHLHTSVKHTRMVPLMSMEPWAETKKALH